MDRQDLAILAELFRDPRAPYASLAREVGLSPNAAKARVRRLEESGVLRGFAAAPSPGLLGMAEGLLVFTDVPDAAEREEDILAGLPDAPGVRFVDVTLDGAVLVWAYARDDADWERIERVAVSVVGKPPTDAFRPAPAPPEDAAPAEWRLLRALLADARAPAHELAERSGLSLKTVKRRLTDLLRSGRVRVEPVLSTSEASGLVLFSLHAQLEPGARAEDVLALLPPATIAQQRATGVTFHVARATAREAQGDLRALRRSPLVERVMLTIATRRRADGWLDDAIGARLAVVPAKLAPVPVPRAR